MSDSFTSALSCYEKKNKTTGEWVVRSATLSGGTLSISEGVNSKKTLQTYDITGCKDPYSAVACFNDTTIMAYSSDIFAFSLDIGDTSIKIPGLPVGVALFGVHSEAKRDEWMGKIQNFIRHNTGSNINQLMAQYLPQHFPQQDSSEDSDELPDLPMNEIEEHDPDIIINQTKKLKLDELDFGGLLLESWPELKGGPIGKRVPKVVILNMSDNSFKKVPEEVFALKNVVEFDISNNKLTSFPEEIQKFQKLEHLVLSGNPITSLPSYIGFFDNLVYLEIENSSIKKIHENIGCLRELTELHLSGNTNLTTIPNSIGELRNLEILDISSCSLSAIPIDLFYNTRLKELTLSKNKIAQIPDEIGHLTKLETCTFQGNNLTAVPVTLLECKSLEVFNLADNPFQDPQLYNYIISDSPTVDALFKILKATVKETGIKIKLDRVPDVQDRDYSPEEKPIQPKSTSLKDGLSKSELRGFQNTNNNNNSNISNQNIQSPPRFNDGQKKRAQARVVENVPYANRPVSRNTYKRSMRVPRKTIKTNQLRNIVPEMQSGPGVKKDQILRVQNQLNQSKQLNQQQPSSSPKSKPSSSSKIKSSDDPIKSKACMLSVRNGIESIKKSIFAVANTIISITNPPQLIPFVNTLKLMKQEMENIQDYTTQPKVHPHKKTITDKFEIAKESILIGFKEINGKLDSLEIWFQSNPPLEELVYVSNCVKSCQNIIDGKANKK